MVAPQEATVRLALPNTPHPARLQAKGAYPYPRLRRNQPYPMQPHIYPDQPAMPPLVQFPLSEESSLLPMKAERFPVISGQAGEPPAEFG
ncbi:hypothetical protein D3C73_1416720 [compost metagenome]